MVDPRSQHLTLAQQDAAFRPSVTHPTAWADLLSALEGSGFNPENHAPTPPNRPITGITMDSRTVQRGDLYVAVPGAHHHGADFFAAAIESGAVGILTDDSGFERIGHESINDRIPTIVVTDVREALGVAARHIYHPSGTPLPDLYGVTGTNGKTTTAYLTTALLDALGETTGLIGTIEIRAGQRNIPARYTTPEATQLHALSALMRQENVTSAVMEVSSHAMSYHRVTGLHYRVAGFTNLTQDHLDLHGSMESYFAAKALLFDRHRTDQGIIILNGGAEPQWGEKLAREATCDVITVDLGPAALHPTSMTADWVLTALEPAGLGHRFTVRHRDGQQLTSTVGLPGRFNVANAVLAALMVLYGAPESQKQNIHDLLAATGIEHPFTTAVPGRMEVISTTPAAIVDFAHNPDGLAECLTAVNQARQASAGMHSEEPPGRTIVVFGATGDRDRSKRALMGRIAATHADVVIVTDDDPHGEEPGPIRQQVLQGAYEIQRQRPGLEIMEIAERSEAIERAVALAQPADAIVLAGRGHETSMDYAGTVIELDDRVALREALKRHGNITIDVASPSTGSNSGKVSSS